MQFSSTSFVQSNNYFEKYVYRIRPACNCKALRSYERVKKHVPLSYSAPKREVTRVPRGRLICDTRRSAAGV
jgi:hypothetical protein